jgi:hypothetical protein
MQQVHVVLFSRIGNLTARGVGEWGTLMSEKDILCTSSSEIFFYNCLQLQEQSTSKHESKISRL